MATVSALDLPMREAGEYFARKMRLPTRAYTDISDGQHSAAFVVAGAMRDSLLASLQSAIQKAIDQGTGLDEFRRDFRRIVAAEGWSYKGGEGWRTLVAIRALSPIDHDNQAIPEGAEAEIDSASAEILVGMGRAEYVDVGAAKKGKGK